MTDRRINSNLFYWKMQQKIVHLFLYAKEMEKFKVPDTYVIIFTVILFCAIATWFVPGGQYIESPSGEMTYAATRSIPQTWQVFSALSEGFSQQASIIVFVLIIGGAFWVVNSTRAVDAGIMKFIASTQRMESYGLVGKLGAGNLIIVLTMLLFGAFGAIFGMSEETIAFTAIVIPLAISLGYDSIVGVCMVYVAAHVGFAGAMLNPFTIGIAQNLSDLPLFSGIKYRTLCWIVLMSLAIVFVLWYAHRVKRHPELSPMYETDQRLRLEQASEENMQYGDIQDKKHKRSAIFTCILTVLALLFFCFSYAKDCTITIGTATFHAPWLLWSESALYLLSAILTLRKSTRIFILDMLLFTIFFLITGVMGFGWYIGEISALFMALAIAAGIASGYSADEIAKKFVEGAKDIFSAALVIGFAAGIVIILKDGKILDTLLHAMATSLGETGPAGSLGAMYGIQTLINLFIPSASAKAAITMPIMAPFSDLIGVSRQATVLAFQFGDGFTNMITPCSGVLLAVLSVAHIPYTVWFKWVWKFILTLVLVGFLLLLPTLFFAFPGF